MSNITLTQLAPNRASIRARWSVKLDGKIVGHIITPSADRYYYQPRGSKNRGDTFTTLEACEQSLRDDT